MPEHVPPQPHSRVDPTITASTTLGPGDVRVRETLIVRRGGRLSIAPGSRVGFAPGCGIVVHPGGTLDTEPGRVDRADIVSADDGEDRDGSGRNAAPIPTVGRTDEIVLMPLAVLEQGITTSELLLRTPADLPSWAGIALELPELDGPTTVRAVPSAPAAHAWPTPVPSGLRLADSVDGPTDDRPFTVDITSVTFVRGETDPVGGPAHAQCGGGMYISHGRSRLRGCRFHQCRAHDRGGAIALEGSADDVAALDALDVAFTDNMADGDGGAIEIGPFADAIVEACWFEGNSAGKRGGAIAIRGDLSYFSRLAATDTTFSRNAAGTPFEPDGDAPANPDPDGRGGAIACNGASRISFNGCKLTENNASGKGGGVDFSGRGSRTGAVVGEFAGCTFDGNRSASLGGALRAGPRSTVRLHTGCKFINNVAETFGGAIAVNGRPSTPAFALLLGTRVEGNRAGLAGGGVYAGDGSTLDLKGGTLVSGNRADDGGGLAAHGHLEASTTVTIADATIARNHAINGGGASVTRVTLTCETGCRINANEATGLGGGLLISGTPEVPSQVDVLELDCEGNKAGDGGGLCARGMVTLIISGGAQFIVNEATGNGGGIALNGEGDPKRPEERGLCRVACEVAGATFRGNSAGGQGGAVAIERFAFGAFADGCTFAANRSIGSGTAIFAGDTPDGPSTLAIDGCRFEATDAERATVAFELVQPPERARLLSENTFLPERDGHVSISTPR